MSCGRISTQMCSCDAVSIVAGIGPAEMECNRVPYAVLFGTLRVFDTFAPHYSMHTAGENLETQRPLVLKRCMLDCVFVALASSLPRRRYLYSAR